jgi:hypothetical protein
MRARVLGNQVLCAAFLLAGAVQATGEPGAARNSADGMIAAPTSASMVLDADSQFVVLKPGGLDQTGDERPRLSVNAAMTGSTVIAVVGENDGVTFDGTYIYLSYDNLLEKRTTAGRRVDSTSFARCGYKLNFGGLYYKDGFLWGVVGKYTPPYQAIVVKIDPTTLTCVEAHDISSQLNFSANAIFYHDGSWFVGETATNIGYQKAIVRLNSDWTRAKTVFSTLAAGLGWQDATQPEVARFM